LYATYDLKATLTKTILSPCITYLAHTYPLPHTKTEQINNIISTYIAGANNPTLPVSTLSQTQQNGGYSVADIPLTQEQGSSKTTYLTTSTNLNSILDYNLVTFSNSQNLTITRTLLDLHPITNI